MRAGSPTQDMSPVAGAASNAIPAASAFGFRTDTTSATTSDGEKGRGSNEITPASSFE